MICVRCGGDNPPSFRFCRKCGKPLGLACLTCGFENPPESKFCGGCGARIEEVRPEDALGERRQLTVLFCDIVGSTQLSQVLDPEDLGELIAAHQRICGEAVLAHEGHIAQYLGDGVVMYFGYPRSHEDESQRAIRCGLDILAGVRSLRDSGKIPANTPLDVRLGAHTGRVVVGPVGAGDRKDRIALGDTPNIANRIQSEGQPGTLTVSAATWKIVEGYFTGSCLGKFQLRGLAEPIELWAVTGESESTDRMDMPKARVPFVGRQQERSALDQAWRDCQTGVSQSVLLRAEPGLGKSRLAQLFRDEVQHRAAEVIGMRGTPYNSNSPFHPAIELIERRLGLERGLSPGERLDLLEQGLQRLGISGTDATVLFASLLSVSTEDRYPPLPLSPARRRSRTMELLMEFPTAIARSGPTLLVVEDLHWMDSSTLEFLELLVTTAPPVPLLTVLTARSELNLDWFAASTLRVVELSRFEPAEAETIVRGVTLGKALPSEVLRRIIVRSDGVPLFVEELTRTVLDSGMLKEKEAAWEAAAPMSAEMIPPTVDASLTSRIDRLGASRATAQLAATIGREFTLELLCEVSERDPATVESDVERLVQAGLAWPTGNGSQTFVFKHALVRDAAYNSLLRSTRQRYHGRIAAALRGRFAEGTATRPDLIAYHLTNAGEDEEAVAFWEAAGQQALARSAVHEAADHFQRAIDCLKRLPVTAERQERELELEILLAPLLMTVYGWGAVEVEQACERALALSQELQRYDRSYPPLWGLWATRFLRGELDSALESAEAVFQMAQASGVPMIELTGRHAISYTRFTRGEYGRAIEEADAGLALYDFEQEKQVANLFGLSSTVCLRSSRAHSLWMVGRIVEAEEECDRLLQLGRDLEHRPSLAAALAFHMYGLAFRHSYEAHMERLVDIADELLKLSKEEDFFLWYAQAYTFRGIVGEALGDHRARHQMLEGLELWEQTGARLTLVMMNVLCAEAFYRLGEDEEAFRRLQVAETEMERRREGPLAPDIWRVRGRLLARQGEPSAADAAYRRAMERARGQNALSLELRAALDLYDLHAHLGRAEDGRALLAGVLEQFTQGHDRPELARAAAIVHASS
jgi:class 3 adenylate cyclase/tetratricopeptide (TPR) repeat protein